MAASPNAAGLPPALRSLVADCRPGGAFGACSLMARTTRPFTRGGTSQLAFVLREATGAEFEPPYPSRWLLIVTDARGTQLRQRLPVRGYYPQAPPGGCFGTDAPAPLVWDPAAGNLLGVFTFCGDNGQGLWFWHAPRGGSLAPGSVPTDRGVAPEVAGHGLTLQPQPSGPLVVSASTGKISPTDAHRLGETTCRWDGSRYRCVTS